VTGISIERDRPRLWRATTTLLAPVEYELMDLGCELLPAVDAIFHVGL
jgi:hypothetical protein